MVRNSLFNNQMQLFLGICDGKYMGFVITETVPSLQGDWINIAFAHGHRKEMTLFGIEYIRRLARELGYRGVKVMSARKGMSRLLGSNGFKKRFVEYVEEFE